MDARDDPILQPGFAFSQDLYSYESVGDNKSNLDDQLFAISVPANSTLLGSFQLMLNTAIGSGTLLVPYCYTLGVGCALIISTIFALIAYTALYFMIKSSFFCQKYDYRGLFSHTFGEKRLWIVNVMIFLVQFGACMIYAHWNGRLMNKVVGSNHPVFGSNAFWCFLISTLLVFPLTIFRQIAKLEKFEILSTISIIVMVIHAIYWFGRGIVEDGFDPDHKLVGFSISDVMINALSVNSMAFNCHINLFPTLEHLSNCTLRRAFTLAGMTVGVSYLLYNMFGLFTYLYLFDNLGEGSALEFYPMKHWFTTITILCVIVSLVLSSPLVIWAARNSINHLIWGNNATNMRWIMIGGTIVLLTSLLASTSDNVCLFFDIFGGLFTPIIIFLMPSLFYLKNVPNLKWYNKMLAIVIASFTVIAACACTYHVIDEIIKNFKK
ncbi:Transmembrane amino acid transporter protein [Tritrichomonas foetus]|uniref:Transmembrane amino acid transporter protein n=1 Tax=Tritrichomonas foetus TaxID=1144522 RepID=A0A1J4KBF5_9EUKA|nr:Transmembrane amino acid transporter protein [Tritrichomonas foetus]|eukprot:OHT08555.1 Transmembrane amino acid transporter protein [Tritrichomonas foetus]